MQGPGEGLPFLPPQEPGERCLGRGSVCADSTAVLSAPSLPQSTRASRGINAPGWGQGETCWADEG